MQQKKSLVETLINWIILAILFMAALVAGVAFLTTDTKDEASIGSFQSFALNEGWILTDDSEEKEVTLPYVCEDKEIEIVSIHRALPNNLPDESSLMTRVSVADVWIYVDGELREEYSTDSIPNMSYYIPSAYVVTTLDAEDAGKDVRIQVHFKDRRVLEEVTVSPGNNVWFPVIFDNLPVSITTLMVLILGVVILLFSFIMRRLHFHTEPAFYLSLLMVDVGLWAFSESSLRQIIFAKPSLTRFFSYVTMEIIGILVALYFDEVQHKAHHKLYLAAELLGIGALLLNAVLHFTGIAAFYQTMFISHIAMVFALVLTIATLISDIHTGRIRSYLANAIGMAGLLILGVVEIIYFYLAKVHVFGLFICSGLVVLMTTTLMQVLLDQREVAKKREQQQSRAVVGTIETIASAIDAKDEYTGGHSDRVGQYAAILARGMAADYNFSEEDIERIHYIGTLHDIGKIGVADSVLNKAGRLTDSEFALMKKHVEIGSDMLEGLDVSIPELRNGIRYHHERFDGKGYPEGLAETEIPLVARIICLADCYDAMTSNRVYRRRLTDEEVRSEIVRCSGTQFDPALAEIFVSLMDSGEIHPLTSGGMSITSEGEVPKSALLENYLQQQALSSEEKILHQSHVRMICYIMKITEKKGISSNVFLVKAGTENSLGLLESLIREELDSRELFAEYYENTYLIVRFDQTPEAFQEFLSKITAIPDTEILKQI